MTTGRDQASPKTSKGTKTSVLPHVRYHPSITAPQKTWNQDKNFPKSTKTKSINCLQTPKSLALNKSKPESKTDDYGGSNSCQLLSRPECGRTLKIVHLETEILVKKSKKNLILPQVRYHPSIVSSPNCEKLSEDLPMMTKPKSSNSKDTKDIKKSLPEVRYHPSMEKRSSSFEELKKINGLRPGGGARAEGDSPEVAGVQQNGGKTRSQNGGSSKSQNLEGESGKSTPCDEGTNSRTTREKGRRMNKKQGKLWLNQSGGGGEGSRGADGETGQNEEERTGRSSSAAEALSGSETVSGLSLDLLQPRPGSALDQELVEQVEVQTQGQRTNPDWFKFRKNRITASVAHAIANSKFANGTTTTVPKSYLKTILGESGRVQTRAMAWGVEHEAEAVLKYQEQQSAALGFPVLVRDCGLFIDPGRPWLAGSPDGIVTDRRTGQWLRCLEVKCPYKHRTRSVKSAAREDRRFCLDITDQEGAPQLPLKRTHPYFTQVQAQMAVTGLSVADFVVFTQIDLAVIQVRFDPDYWEQTVRKLEKFYREAVIPALREKNWTEPGLNQDLEERERREAWRRES